ncbi:proline-rich protein 5-like isoform X2 [Haliotis rubra]|uniref:proline-rich protein 5-like isoform X2 n=1 Tax=Haliotis rubra TaxID=36100 RepID=UPI001EE537D7|nr:proline-rich protein 5-like isoform X2 [Haliotis rubra]
MKAEVVIQMRTFYRKLPWFLKGHSLANVDIGSRLPRGGRRGSTIPGLGVGSPSDASNRQQLLESIQAAIVQLFQRKKLKENELGILQENVRYLAGTEAGPLILDYYKDQLLKKGMVIMRESIKNDRGTDLMKKLGETWDYFYTEILPDLQAVLYPLKTTGASIRQVTLVEFRNIVMLKVSIEDALDNLTGDVPPSIRQMLLILQSVCETFPGENYYKLEKLVARVVVPYLGLRGLYMGNPEPVIRSSSRIVPKVTVSGSTESISKEHDRNDETKHTWSPVMTKKHAHRFGNGLHGNAKLAPVFEHVYDGGRRHSIIS